MFMVTNLTELHMWKLIYNGLLGMTVQNSAMDFWTVTFFKMTLGKDCLELCFWGVDFKNYTAL